MHGESGDNASGVKQMHAGTGKDSVKGSAKDSAKDSAKGAGVRFPPPLILLLCLLGGSGMHYLMPLRIGFAAPLNLIGLVFVFAALVIVAICALAFRRAATAIEPWKPTTTVLYDGCYSFTRNPIYLSFCLLLFGIGITADSLWILLSAVPCGISIYFVAIVREEAYLEQKFGADYLQYKKKVRRWL